ncbi:MAG: DNA-3-methyladenine glycosylase I [Bacteroidales bacterium]|nr:DNA-3-methyladenine glycosylase I [Bacteroidales bacterium]MDT8430768.1 DNA-3-methyladenine glycosylase I [Bacteroidales bacterium]
MEKKRCDWCLGNDLYIEYHDNEWVVPVHDDREHFEFLGTTIMYAHLQSIGVINDHLADCFRYKELK